MRAFQKADQRLKRMRKILRILSLNVSVLALLVQSADAQPAYDLVLKGGHVLDAKNQIDAVRR